MAQRPEVQDLAMAIESQGVAIVPSRLSAEAIVNPVSCGLLDI